MLKGADLHINRGEITVIIGKSGEGKSVILKHIIGLIEPDSGEILSEGRPVNSMKSAEIAAFRNKFSYMFQGTALFDSMNVYDNVVLPLRERTKMSESEIKERARSKMDQLDLHEIDDKYPSQISGGMKKRVALARALITDPEIVLFDEPTTGLDPIRKNAVHSMISEYQAKFGFTGVVVSHDMPDVFYISQHIAFLNEGKIIFEGGYKEIQNFDDPTVNQFIHGYENREDALTGLDHQAQGKKHFMEEMARLQRYHTKFSLALLTVENLDEVNNKVGHITGTTMLRNFSEQIQRFLRVNDASSRHSMNQIMILLHNSDTKKAKMIMEKFAKEFKGYGNNIVSGAKKPCPGLCFSVSVGFAEVEEDSPLEQVINIAESSRTMFYDFKTE